LPEARVLHAQPHYKQVGKYAACHAYEIEEAFLIIGGVLTVSREKEG
jgi:hypothetical protein